MPFDKRLEDYVTVADRIVRFRELYPEGVLQSEILEINEKKVVMKGFAFRTPADPRPGIGHAEEIRDDSPVNRTSALENCETSAWGRALAALGLEVKKGIASREEVEKAKRREEVLEKPSAPPTPAPDKPPATDDGVRIKGKDYPIVPCESCGHPIDQPLHILNIERAVNEAKKLATAGKAAPKDSRTGEPVSWDHPVHPPNNCPK